MDYSRYDLNSDGFVTALELADATGTNLEDCRLPFKNADKNGESHPGVSAFEVLVVQLFKF